jgi:hypothetical protein
MFILGYDALRREEYNTPRHPSQVEFFEGFAG